MLLLLPYPDSSVCIIMHRLLHWNLVLISHQQPRYLSQYKIISCFNLILISPEISELFVIMQSCTQTTGGLHGQCETPINTLEYYYSPLDGMLVHHRVTSWNFLVFLNIDWYLFLCIGRETEICHDYFFLKET